MCKFWSFHGDKYVISVSAQLLCQCWIINRRFRDFVCHHRTVCRWYLYILWVWCLFLFAYYAVGGRSQTVRSHIPFKHFSVAYPGVLVVKLFCFIFACPYLCLLGIFVIYVCWSSLIHWCWDSMLRWVSASPHCLYSPDVIHHENPKKTERIMAKRKRNS
jgi:hypothetical protein